jgi:uncharacterized protein YneF (UPF0154 family)
MSGAEANGTKALKNMNRSVYFFGLTSLQLIVAFMVIVVGLIVGGVYGIAVIPVIVFLTSRIRKENMAGHPNYLQSLWAGMVAKPSYSDPTNTLKRLLKNE